MIKQIITRCLIVFVVLILAVNYCMSLDSENMRKSVSTLTEELTPDLGDGDVLTQKLVIDEGEQELHGIALFFSENDINPEGIVNVQLFQDGTNIREWSRKGQFIKIEELEYFLFDSPIDCKGHEYKLKVEFEGFGDIKPISFRTEVFNEESRAIINGVPTNNSIYCLNVYETIPTWKIVAVPVLIFSVFFVWQLIYFFLIKPKFKTGSDGDFASVFIALLLLYYFVVPLNTVSDEGNHFLRSYSIAHGNLISDVLSDNNQGGDILPDGIVTYAERFNLNGFHKGLRQHDRPLKELHADWNNVREAGFTNTSINVPYLYFPQALGIRVAEFFTDSPYYMVYSGRFVNAVIFAFVALFAIKITPSGKEFFKFSLLLPVMMQESVSLAPDGLISALVMLYIAFILRLRFSTKKNMETKHYLIAFVLTILVAVCKLVYAPVCFLLFLVPAEKFGSRSRYRITVMTFAMAIVTFLLSWLMLISRYNLRLHYSNSSMQIDYIFAEPGKVLSVFGNYFLDSGKYLSELIERNIGYNNIPIPSAILFVFTTIAVTICYSVIKTQKGSMYVKRIIPLVCVLLSYFLIGLSEYLGWSKVGSGYISGIMGRYYLPMVPIFFFSITGIDEDKPVSENENEKIGFALSLSNLFVLTAYWIYCVY